MTPLALPAPFTGIELHQALGEITRIGGRDVEPGKRAHERVCRDFPYRKRPLPLKLTFVADHLHSAEVSRPLGTEQEEVMLALREEVSALTAALGGEPKSMIPATEPSAEGMMRNVAAGARRFPQRATGAKLRYEMTGFNVVITVIREPTGMHFLIVAAVAA